MNDLPLSSSINKEARQLSQEASSSLQLWPFLIELLTNKEAKSLIRWVGFEGEFEFLDPEQVARMWGQQKSNSTMNFAKLSRALRNYYSNGIISKVNSQQYIYKFMFDLKCHLGYSVEEICTLLEYGITNKSILKRNNQNANE